ncbi:MAG: transglutaminase-like domain-containing protein, partial [Firmicutes bacterium]|nr:transglutaminase-like domain-containing protein [Bacillota bacterium]
MNRKKILAMLSAILAAVLTFTISCFVLVSGASETAEVSDFFRNQLGTNGELIYDSLGTAHPGSGEITVALKEPIFFNSVTLQPTQEEMSNAKYELYCQVQGAFDALLADQPEMFCMDPGKIKYSYKYVGRIINMIPTWAINEVIISYGPNDDVAGHENEALSELRTAALSVSFSGSIYERAEKIYEYLRKNVTYTEDISNSIWQTAYGALVNGKASSKGFAHAFAYLCRYNGIDAVCVNGYIVNKGIRVWNYIIADDGMWYAVDTCGGNEEFTLFGTETKINGKSTFSEIYFPSGDFSGTQMNFFSYPKLAVQE